MMQVYSRNLDWSYFSKFTFGNGESVDIKDKGVVTVKSPLGNKYI